MEDPEQKNPATSGEGNPPAEDTSGSTPVIRTIIEIPQSVMDEYRRAQQAENREHSKNRTVAWWAVFGAFTYALIAGYQSCLMRETEQIAVLNNRPVLYENGVKATEKTPDGIPSKVRVRFRNFGKSLAVGIVDKGHIVTRDAGEPTPIDPDCDATGKLPKSDFIGATAPDEVEEPDWGPAEGEDLSAVNRGKVLYVTGCVYYFGIDRVHRYFSDLCVVWAPKAQQDFQSCGDSRRNNPD